MAQHYYTTIKSPLGELLLTSNGKEITGLYTKKDSHFFQIAKSGIRENKPFTQAIKQLDEYFNGKRHEFDLPISANGTEFQQNVWKSLKKIGYGKTKSYSELAKSIGKPKASRAVGSANGKNPLCIIIPCHRVINSDGGLGGYNGGIQIKKWLLEHEANNSNSSVFYKAG